MPKRRSHEIRKRRQAKQKERDLLEHLRSGFEPYKGKGKYSPKGVEIRAQSGVKDINPEIKEGVEIHDERYG